MIGTSSGKTIMATNKVLGRSTAGTGAIEEISIGSNLTLSGGTLSASGGVTGVAASATDILSVSGSDIAADDPGADRLVFWDDSDNKLTYLTAGSGLTITGTTIAASGGIGGSTGSVDNAILRADGTGGATLQTSGLVAEDAIVSFTSITGDALTDVITATGSAFTDGQPVRFTALTGGSGLNTTTNYFVREVSGATFKVETSIGGGAINFTTNITAGTLLTGHSVQVNVTLSENTTETNSALVLSPKGTGAFILGPKPDGTTTGGNARGSYAIDLQTVRNNANQVARGTSHSIILGGANNTSSAFNHSVVCGGEGNTASANYAVVCGGQFGTASGVNSFVAGGQSNTASGGWSFVAGSNNTVTASGQGAHVLGNINTASGTEAFCCNGNNQSTASRASALGHQALANRINMQAYASGSFSNTTGSGDAQRARFVLRCKTTTNTGVEMALDGATTYLGIPANKVIALTINISGVKSDGSAVAHYLRQYCVKNVGGTSSEVYAPVTIGTDNAAGTTIALSANNADDTLRILVTGVASETWRWVAAVDAVEITYGT